jgi:hypothetical protein
VSWFAELLPATSAARGTRKRLPKAKRKRRLSSTAQADPLIPKRNLSEQAEPPVLTTSCDAYMSPFSGSDRDKAAGLLLGARIHDGSLAEPRLQRCALVASQGSPETLQYYVKLLAVDFRDVIVAGEYESITAVAGGPKVLKCCPGAPYRDLDATRLRQKRGKCMVCGDLIPPNGRPKWYLAL